LELKFMIAGILLAAGESRRMGQFKQLLRLGEKTFVEHCVDHLLASRVNDVVVVTGHRDADVRLALGDRPVSFVYNEKYKDGMASSIKSGIDAVSESAKACVISLVDQPQIGSELINSLIDEYEIKGPLIVIPAFEGRNGHPILLDFTLREEILNMSCDEGLRQVVRAHQSQTIHLDVKSSLILEDCDMPADYDRLLNRRVPDQA